MEHPGRPSDTPFSSNGCWQTPAVGHILEAHAAHATQFLAFFSPDSNGFGSGTIDLTAPPETASATPEHADPAISPIAESSIQAGDTRVVSLVWPARQPSGSSVPSTTSATAPTTTGLRRASQMSNPPNGSNGPYPPAVSPSQWISPPQQQQQQQQQDTHGYPATLIDPMDWPPTNVQSSDTSPYSAAHPPPEQATALLEQVLISFPIPHDFDFNLPQQSVSTPSFDICASESPPSESHYLPSPTPVSHHGSRDFVASNSVLPLGPQPNARKRERTPNGRPKLEFVSYNPTSAGELTRKRSAEDDGRQGADPLRTIKKISHKGDGGELQGLTITSGNPVSKRSSFAPDKRAETAIARKEGVCSRCKDSKRKCNLALQTNPYRGCSRCENTKTYKGLPRMPCFRETLKDILFFRAGPAANEPLFNLRFSTLAETDISKPNVDVQSIQLTQKIGNHRLTVYASEFTPLPHDKVSYTWMDKEGNTNELKMPPFCLTNMFKVKAQILQYIYEAKRTYLKRLTKDDPLVDPLVKITVAMALNYEKKKQKSLVALALDLWAVSRMIEIQWQMCPGDPSTTLGVTQVTDKANPRYGMIPIPPMMDTQLDQIIISYVLNPLKKKLIDKFEEMISPAKPEDWFDIYLTSFILLNHIEKLAEHSAFHATLHSMQSRFSNTGFLESVFHSAKAILSRFHFACNGSAPFRADWELPTTVNMAQLEANEVEFMKQSQALIVARKGDFLTLRKKHRYEGPLYWSGQLHTEDWDDTPARVVELPSCED
ncbi:hypothetical protein B0H67DRAFT_578859 [Lasiosphaeris hirsuta]|uniref:Zn(2)-C6 fungal-type domain-containing protein n=1 Tax=Lasiosphaeris hirsuta TaxID=260670 RepID=A0AA40AF40_9PEZI|nr:hypothetical protein B0H67DRAFT_578859 [Lasiosphaeris hirsuta]